MRRSKLLQFLTLTLQITAIPLTVIAVIQGTNLFSRATGTKAELTIDLASSFGEKPPVWRNLAQGGEENRSNTLSSTVEHIKSLQPSYIRVDHIYDFYDVASVSPDGSLTFNWQRLDTLIADIQATGAKPFLSLSYMPDSLTTSNTVGLPSNWSQWQELVRKTIEHVSGELAIEDVYYEVWNEPDLFGEFKTYGDKNYLELYRHSALAAAEANVTTKFKIGGPATTALYKNWFDNLLTFVTQNQLRFDFYSWHRYSQDLGDYEIDIRNAQNWLVNYPSLSQIELIISEIGPDPEVNTIYDNQESAIHTIATSVMLDKLMDKTFIFEIKDGPHNSEKFWGRWGILTNEIHGEPFKKPRYYAIEFLNNLRGSVMTVIGEGSWVKASARKDENASRIIVVNYDKENSHSEAVPITLQNVPSSFTWRRRDFLGQSRETPIATTSAIWQTIEFFEPNSAALFEVIPQ